jgi:hypothetical protein
MRAKPWRAVIVAAAIVLSTLAAYRLGKDCGAWEAKRRLRGEVRPTLCFQSEPGRAGR